MLEINSKISIDENCLSEVFVRSTGPGGQNVNKVSTAVCLKMNLATCGLDQGVKVRLRKIAGVRHNSDDEIIIICKEHRSQIRNREAARDRLIELVRKALFVPKKRKKTKATKGSKERRIKAKKSRGDLKKGRQKVKY